MLNIYLRLTPDIIRENDRFYGSHTVQLLAKEPMDSEARRLCTEIEGVPFVSEKLIVSKFYKGAHVPITQLATGTKTLMNIYFFKDKIFSTEECGGNVLDLLCTLNAGNFYTNRPLLPPRASLVDNKQYCVVLPDKKIICTGIDKVNGYFVKYTDSNE